MMMTSDMPLITNMAIKCARFILRESLTQTESGCWTVYASEIAEATGYPVLSVVAAQAQIAELVSKTEAALEPVASRLEHDVGTLDDRDDWAFDGSYDGSYCPSYSTAEMPDDFVPGSEYEKFIQKIDTVEYWKNLMHCDSPNPRDALIFQRRGFGAITNDAALMEYARKRTGNWYEAGWSRSFTAFYLSDYAVSEPYASLTDVEFARLKELQKAACEKAEAEDAKKEWRHVRTESFADNSVEEVWADRDGNEKRIMTVYPHGD